MADLSDLCIYTTERGGKWFAATNASPYFCFEAASEEAALAEAKRALDLFERAMGQADTATQERDNTPVSWSHRPARELVAA